MRKVNRLTKYDYSTPGHYFVTLCTFGRQNFFSEINKGELVLNNYGKIADEIWLRTPVIYSGTKLDEYVIMPNHLHGIIIIEKQATGLHYSLSQIIGGYKNTVTKIIRQNLNRNFAWQPSFYDHVIRKEEGLNKIREYIQNNPLKWEIEKNNPENLWI